MNRVAVLLLLAGTMLAIACSKSTGAKDEKLCTPGAYVFCRCQDREEGAKLCNETGDGFGKCEPCETDSNPEIPTDGTSSSSGSSGFPQDDAGGDGDVPSNGMCGNGIPESGEDCDDNNTNDTDGCDTSCKLAGTNPSPTMGCPGLEVHVWGGGHKPTLVGSTPGSGNRSASPTCTNQPGNSTTGAAAGDRVFKVVAHKTGTLNVVLSDTNYDAFLYAGTACEVSGSESYLACRNGVNGPGAETLTMPVTSGTTYHVFVDGAGISTDKEGAFRVTFSIP
jgi:cysteine-rich repeat protein